MTPDPLLDQIRQRLGYAKLNAAWAKAEILAAQSELPTMQTATDSKDAAKKVVAGV